ncbi:MAG: GntR family transcriptional regulator [Alphaproteobacteria bacterium]
MTGDSQPTKLRDKAYIEFTRHLFERDVRPGQFVSQRELVALTGLPLGAIRELIPRLEVEGLIVTVPQRGMQIAHIDLNLIREAFQFRLFIEREAIALFTLNASDALLAQLRREHEAAREQAAREGATPELEARAQAIDWGFHDLLIDSLGNRIIAEAYRVNSVKIRLIRQEYVRIDGQVDRVMGEHLSVIEAIESRDPAQAQAALTRHIDNARNLALTV